MLQKPSVQGYTFQTGNFYLSYHIQGYTGKLDCFRTIICDYYSIENFRDYAALTCGAGVSRGVSKCIELFDWIFSYATVLYVLYNYHLADMRNLHDIIAFFF